MTRLIVFAALLVAVQPIIKGSGSQLYGQAPAEYQDLYVTLDNNLANFEGVLASSWDGSKSPVAFSAELKSAHSNQGTQLLGQYYYNGVLLELDSLKALGVGAVTVTVNYPILHPSFYPDSATYQQYVNFYTRLAGDVRGRGLKLIIKTGATFSQTNFGLSGVRAFYDALSLTQYQTGRAETAVAIVQAMHPDFLSVIGEPDTEAVQTGKSDLGTVNGSTNLLNAILNGLSQANVQGVAVGAGIGSWMPSYQAYIDSFAQTSLSYIDVHVYPINLDYLPRLLQIADQAASYGKPVAISEAWLSKVRDPELIALPADQAFARDPFSFWTPLDDRFVGAMIAFAHYKHLLFLSPFWTDWFHCSLDYYATLGWTPSQLFQQAGTLMIQQLMAGQYSTMGLDYAQRLINPADQSAPTIPGGVWAATVPTGINVLWQAATDNIGVAGYTVYRNGSAIATTSSLYYRDQAVIPSASYSYQIAAYDVSGNASAPSTAAVARAPRDTTPPTTPAQLIAQPVSQSQINLSWTPSSDNFGIASYSIYRNGAVIATATAASFSDTALTPATTYSYAVSATDVAGNSSGLSAAVSAVTLGDTSAPTTPSGLVATPASTSSITLSWSSSSDNVGVAGYQVYRGTSPGTLTLIATIPGTSYADSGLAGGTTYYYAVAAYDAAGNSSSRSATASAATVGDTLAPTAPAGLVATPTSASSITLSWSPSSDNIGVAGYKIYRGTSSGALSLIATITGTSYADNGLAGRTTYYYAVAAYDAAGNTSALTKASARTKRF